MFLISLSNSIAGNFSNKPRLQMAPLLNYNTTTEDDRNISKETSFTVGVSETTEPNWEQRPARDRQTNEATQLKSILLVSDWLTASTCRGKRQPAYLLLLGLAVGIYVNKWNRPTRRQNIWTEKTRTIGDLSRPVDDDVGRYGQQTTHETAKRGPSRSNSEYMKIHL